MRFYSVEIGGDNAATYTSFVDGQNDPNALNIDLDIQAASFAAPMGNSVVTIWGVSLQVIRQAKDFNGAPITVRGGMGKGLPLATAAFNAGQQGILCQGTVFQAFGNWVDTEQYLTLIIITDGGATQSAPANLSYLYKKGTKLGDGIQQTLSTAYPDKTVTVRVSDQLVLTEDETGTYQTIEQYAANINEFSKVFIPENYNGIDISLQPDGKTILVQDGTMPQDPVELAFQDLIGQPTWFGVDQISFNTVLRADLAIGKSIKFPKGIPTTSSPAELAQQAKDQTSFQGNFTISMMRHVGSFRDPQGLAWITNFQAYGEITDNSQTALPDAQG